jgi:hypothetical protein
MNARTWSGTRPSSFTKQLPGSVNEGIDDFTGRACSTILPDLNPCREDALDYGQKPLALTLVLNSGNEKLVGSTCVFRGKTRCRFASDDAESVETGNKSRRSRLSCWRRERVRWPHDFGVAEALNYSPFPRLFGSHRGSKRGMSPLGKRSKND